MLVFETQLNVKVYVGVSETGLNVKVYVGV